MLTLLLCILFSAKTGLNASSSMTGIFIYFYIEDISMKANLRSMLQTLGLAALVLTVSVLGTSTASAQTTSTKVPVTIPVFIPCANDGDGEFVEMTGTLHVLTHISTNANGCVTMKNHFQPMNLSGVGDVSGDKYQGNGGTQSVTQDKTSCGDGCIIEDRFVNNYRMIGQGPGNNFQVHQVMKVTYNVCTNETTVVVEQESVECF